MKPSETMSGSVERELFLQALEKPAGRERAVFLDRACGDARDRRRRLGALLQKLESLDMFLEQPAVSAPDSLHRLIAVGDSRIETVSANTLSEKAGDRIDRYKLLQQIGEGGCGVVYMAEQEEPVRRRVALKVIKLGMDTNNVIARFEAERQALAMMDHPNISKVLDAGATASGRPYFVMELVHGVKVTAYCDRNNLPTRQRLELFIQICRAVQHAHQKGVIHRDIKPSNILVTLQDGIPVPKIIDFGIAKATTQQRLTEKTLFTQFEQFLGTPAYMSPEQAEMGGLDIDTRTDIYSLGVLLYELLTGKTPFDSEELLAAGLDDLRRTIQEKVPLRPSARLSTMLASELTTTAKRRGSDAPKLIHALRGDLDWIVMKALEKDRTRRYDTANDLAMDLQRHLNNEAVIARPPSWLYRLHKLVRRHKLAFAAATAVAAALVVGIGISTWQAVVATRAKTDAVQAKTKAVVARQAEASIRLEAESQLYAAKMNLAQQAWDQNNVGRLRQLLEETGVSTDRGFEWYYWQRQTHLVLRTLRGHLQLVASVAFSPDGQRIVTGSDDQTAKVWEAASGRELLTFKGHSAPIWSAAFSPDGQRIVTGSDDQTAKVWEAASGREVLTLKGHSAPICSVAFSPDGQRIVTASRDRTAKVWEAASGKELLTFKGHSAPICSVAFSPDGQRIVTGSDDKTAKVWETASGQELLTFKGHGAGIRSVAFSPDGQSIVSGSDDQTAKVWGAAGGRELLTLKGHSARIYSVAFSPDGLRIVTGSRDQTAKVWEAASGRELLTLKGHSARIYSVAFSPDGLRIATGSDDQTAKVWEWRAVSGQELLTLSEHTARAINSVAFSPDGQRIVTGGDDQKAKVWEAASGRELLTLEGHSAPIWSVAFSPDGQRIVTGSGDQTAKVWEAASGRELFTLRGHSVWIGSVAFSPDGQRIITGSGDYTARVWRTANGEQLLTLKGHRDRIRSAAFSPDGQRIVTGSDDRTAKVWEATSGRELLTLKGHSSGISSVAFSPDGQRIVTGSDDQTARVWESASGQELLTLKGHSSGINSVTFSPDGQRIVTGSEDQTARVWEAVSGRELLVLKGHSSGINSVAFSADGQRIVTGSADQTARVWEAASAEQVSAWQQQERAADQHNATLQHVWAAEQQRQRISASRDEGALKRWLLLAPIALPAGQSGAEGLNIEQIEGEGQLKPKAGETRSIGGLESKWQPVALKDYVIDFNAILGHETPQSVAYAVCYFRSEAEQRGLQMLVGSDDEAKVYLNGKQIYKSPFPRSFIAGQDRVPDVSLNAGLNVLVFKVVNETKDWKGSIRLTDSQGNPVQGIKVTGPELKD